MMLPMGGILISSSDNPRADTAKFVHVVTYLCLSSQLGQSFICDPVVPIQITV